jgi:hypothetical protein
MASKGDIIARALRKKESEPDLQQIREYGIEAKQIVDGQRYQAKHVRENTSKNMRHIAEHLGRIARERGEY